MYPVDETVERENVLIALLLFHMSQTLPSQEILIVLKHFCLSLFFLFELTLMIRSSSDYWIYLKNEIIDHLSPTRKVPNAEPGSYKFTTGFWVCQEIIQYTETCSRALRPC